MAKKIKVLDNVSGVEQIINVSSLASNGTITGSDLMLIEQSNTLKKVSITDLSAEFSGGGFALPVDETYSGGADNSFAFKLTGDENISGQTIIDIRLPAPEFEYNNVGLQINGGDGSQVHPLIIKSGEKVTNNNQPFISSNWLSLLSSNYIHIGGSYQNSAPALINGGIIFDTASNSVKYYDNSADKYIDFKYSDNSTQNLNFYIKNTKATLEDGDILVFDDTDSTFKVDNISNHLSGAGNTYTISLPFSKGGGNVNGSVTVPENAILLNCWIKIEEELSTTGAPFLIRLDGSSPLLIGEQGVNFTEEVGIYLLYTGNGGGVNITESFYKVLSTDSGVLQANHSGSGFGSGIIYLQYSTELS